MKHCLQINSGSYTQHSLQTIASGCYPQAWKLARIVPIHKSGDKATPSNYRPISILSIVSKLLERHVHTVVFNFLAVNAPLHASGALCPIGQPPLHSAQLLTTGPRHLMVETKSAQFFSTYVKPLIVSHIFICRTSSLCSTWTLELLHGFTVI